MGGADPDGDEAGRRTGIAQTLDRRPTIGRSRGTGTDSKRWYAVWTRSHCEQIVHDQLAAKGFELFLPEVDIWSSRAGARRLISTPMFPGYLFVHHAMDKTSYLEMAKTRGLVKILGEQWD